MNNKQGQPDTAGAGAGHKWGKTLKYEGDFNGRRGVNVSRAKHIMLNFYSASKARRKALSI